MGLFMQFIMNGFSRGGESLYSPGTLFELRAKLQDNDAADRKMGKVKALVSSWSTSREMLAEQGMEPSAYALEVHANNEPNHPQIGYGTYVFVPDEVRDSSLTTMTTTYSDPLEVQDDEDPLKVLADLYANEAGFSSYPSLAIYELGLRKPDYYPLRLWDRGSNDPMDGLFSIFELIPQGEFAGISLVLVQPADDWRQPAWNHIRSIEDPNYVENLSIGRRIWHMVQGSEMPATGDTDLTGYEKRPLSPQERDEINEINKKTASGAVAFRCTMRVYASSHDLAQRIVDVISRRTASATQGQALLAMDTDANLRDAALRKEGGHRFILTSDEIATLWHVPDESLYGERAAGGRLCHRPSPSATRPPDELAIIRDGGPGDLQLMLEKIRGSKAALAAG